MGSIKNFRDLRVYQNSLDAAMKIFEITKAFPAEEKYSMVDQIRRSSRSVCANIAEAWRKRLYKAHFVSKLSDSAGESDETRVWLEILYAASISANKLLENWMKHTTSSSDSL
jgi:four helix bundle protein